MRQVSSCTNMEKHPAYSDNKAQGEVAPGVSDSKLASSIDQRKAMFFWPQGSNTVWPTVSDVKALVSDWSFLVAYKWCSLLIFCAWKLCYFASGGTCHGTLHKTASFAQVSKPSRKQPQTQGGDENYVCIKFQQGFQAATKTVKGVPKGVRVGTLKRKIQECGALELKLDQGSFFLFFCGKVLQDDHRLPSECFNGLPVIELRIRGLGGAPTQDLQRGDGSDEGDEEKKAMAAQIIALQASLEEKDCAHRVAVSKLLTVSRLLAENAEVRSRAPPSVTLSSTQPSPQPEPAWEELVASSEEGEANEALLTDHGAAESDAYITKHLEILAWKGLFDTIDINKDGQLSMAELETAMEGESKLMMSRSRKLQGLIAEIEGGKKDGIQLTEFAGVMKEMFHLGYKPLFKSADIALQLTEAAWKHVIGEGSCKAVLREECQHIHCFGSLQKMNRDERIKIFRTLLRSIVEQVAERLADDVVAGREYQKQQQQQQQGTSKFADMELGDPLCFDFGIEMLGLPDLDFEKAVRREHSGKKKFKARNNDTERETSPAEQMSLVLPDGWEGQINNKDYHGNVMCAEGFENHAMTKLAGLMQVELVMLRLYTGPMYVIYNSRLRKILVILQEQLHGKEVSTQVLGEALKEVRRVESAYVTSILVLVSALVKLRTVCDLPPDKTVFRGFAGLNPPERFTVEDERGNRGGVEFGFLSTSTCKAQAMGYIDFERGMPQLYEMQLGQIDRGSDVSWISYFPQEAEMLLPPLCSLEANGDPRYEDVEQTVMEGTQEVKRTLKVMVWPVRVNVNLKGKTLDEHKAMRKILHTQMANNALSEVTARLELAKTSLPRESEQAVVLEELAQCILTQCEIVVDRYMQKEDGDFNDDSSYSAAIQDVVQLSPWATGLLQMNSLGISLDELKALQIDDYLPSSVLQSAAAGSTVASKAALTICKQRGVFQQHIEEKDNKGNTPLCACVEEDKAEEIRLLLFCGARANSTSVDGVSPVFVAAQNGHTAALEALVAAGGNVDQANVDGVSPVFVAAQNGHTAALEALVAAGGNVDQANVDGVSPVFVAAQNGHNEALLALMAAGCNTDQANKANAYRYEMAARGSDWPPTHSAADDAHFAKLRRQGRVHQIWLVTKQDGGQDVLHNYADGSFKAYKHKSDERADMGTWGMKDGAYWEESFRGDKYTGKLVGNKSRFHMDVDCGKHGYFRYTPTFEAYVKGTLERELPMPLPHDKDAARLALVEKGSADAVIFEHAQALAKGETFVPLTLKGRGGQAAIVLTEPRPESVVGGRFKRSTPAVGTAKAAVRARLDTEGGHLTMESNGFVLDVHGWRYEKNNKLWFLQEGEDAASRQTRNPDGGRSFVVNLADGTLSPAKAPALVLGVTSVAQLCLVEKGSSRACVFAHAAALKQGGAALLELATPAGLAVVSQYETPRSIGDYCEIIELGVASVSSEHPAVMAVYETGTWLCRDTVVVTQQVTYKGTPVVPQAVKEYSMVFDVAGGMIEEGTAVNMLQRFGVVPSKEEGLMGRAFAINDDGTVSPKAQPDLVLGMEYLPTGSVFTANCERGAHQHATATPAQTSR